MAAIVPQHQDAYLARNNPEQKMVAKYVKPCAADVVLEKSKSRWICSDSILRSLNLRKEPVA